MTARPHVRFEYQSVPLEYESRQEGRPVYREAEFVIYRMPGDKHTEVVKEITEQEKAEWRQPEFQHKNHIPSLYEAWKNGLDAPVNGTALKDWPTITPAQLHQALALGIRTVEDFANLSEEGIRNFGFGARELQKKARTFLDYGNDQGKVIETVAAQQTQIENQTALMQQMQEKMAAMEAALKEAQAKPEPKKAEPKKAAKAS